VAEGVLPFVGLALAAFLVDLKDAGKNVRSRPPAVVFAIVWFLIACLYFLSLLIAAMNFETTSLVLIAVFAFLFFLGCVIWVVIYAKNKKQAIGVLLFTTLAAVMTTINGVTGHPAQDSFSPTVVAMLTGPFGVWCMFALLLNVLEVEK